MQIMTGTHGSHYVMCMGCRQITPVLRTSSPAKAEEPLPAAKEYQPPTGMLS
jgi:hypothetical protein